MWTLELFAWSYQSDLPLRTHLPPRLSPHYLGWMSSSPGLQGYTRELAKPFHLLATVGSVRLQIIPVRLTPKNCKEDRCQSCWGHQVERIHLREKLPKVKHFWGKRRKKDGRAETEIWWHCFRGSGSRLPWGSARYVSKKLSLEAISRRRWAPSQGSPRCPCWISLTRYLHS